MLKRHNGQNLIDYTLILSLIVVVALGGIVMFSGQLKQFFDDRQADLNASASAVVTSVGQPSGNGGTSPVGGQSPTGPVTTLPINPPVSNPGPSTTVTITLPNGQKIALSNYPTDLKQLIETAGASGTTTILAQIMMQFAQQMAATGEITPEQNNELIGMANSGFRVAAIQKVMEDKIQAMQAMTPAQRTAAGQVLNNQTLVFEGVTYAAQDLIGRIDATPGKDPNGAQNGGVDMYALTTAHKSLTDKGLDWNTPQGVFFQTLATQLIDTADGTPNSWGVLNDLSKWSEQTVSGNMLSTNQASNTSQTNSTGICGLGNGQAKNLQCN